MLQPDLIEQVYRLRFDDPAIEATYHAERRQRDICHARRVLLTLALLVAVLGLTIIGTNGEADTPAPKAWFFLRFGLLVPGLLTMWLIVGRPWGQARLQAVLAVGLAMAAGVHALEWAVEWTTAMPLRTLWLIPAAIVWATVMTVPLSTRAGLIACTGALGIAIVGMYYFVSVLTAPALAAMALGYALCGWAITLFTRWRERDWRMLFALRRESDLLAEKLGQQNKTLQQLTEQRNEFVAGVLHDLRSPLTAIQLSTELIRHDETMPREVRSSLLDGVARSVSRVAAFANRFLEQRSLERATATLTLAPVSCDSVVDAAVENARVNAGKKQQRIELVCSTPGQLVVADELLFDRALGNLLDNALKYSPPGATITVRIADDSGVPARVLVAVDDAGPGLSAAEQAQVFRPYVRLNKKPTGGEPSTGLGLSLVKHCIESMGGAVGCESTPGRGATFWLALHRARVPAGGADGAACRLGPPAANLR